MSVEVDYFYYDNVWQDAGAPVTWWWPMNQPVDGRYWSFAIVPEYANVAACNVVNTWLSTDNRMQLTANFTIVVNAPAGSLLGFKAIRAPSV